MLLSEQASALLFVAFGMLYVIASAIVGGRLASISIARNLGVSVPPLMTTNPFKNWRALFFLYTVSPWRFQDAVAIFLIYLIRASCPLALLFGVIALRQGLRP